MREPLAFRRIVAGIALAKVGLGLVATVVTLGLQLPGLTGQYLLFSAIVAVFGSVGVLLLRAMHRDERAELLGIVFLLVATPFADRLIRPLQAVDGPAYPALRAFFALQVSAFFAFYVWRFVQEFPRQTELARVGRVTLIPALAFWVGVFLFVANVALYLVDARVTGAAREPLWLLSRYTSGGLYWPALYLLTLPALPLLFLRARAAPLEERRRVSLLAVGLVIGGAPAFLWSLAGALWPWVDRTLPIGVAGWVIYPALLSMPLTTAYAVLVRHALDASLVIRRALQYALARYSIMAIAALPLLLLALTVYDRRNESMSSIVTSGSVPLLVLLSAFGALVLRGRRGLLERVDRRFFREQYDARRILGELVDKCRRAGSRSEMERALREEIDRALHPERVELMLLSADGDRFATRYGTVRPLSVDSGVARRLAHGEPFEVTLDGDSPGLLPRDRHWASDAGAALIVPLRDAQRVLGLILLGEKKSELPYSREDRRLLAGVAAAAELALGYYGLEPDSHPTPAESAAAFLPAAECPSCGSVAPAGTLRCARCGDATTPAGMPQVIGGKFRLEERIGAGGMGVVYRATDTQLHRAVAVKTLPEVEPGRGLRMRREARAMAAVSHPHLAHIYGIETLHGRPMLIVEYLPGGTLAQRLRGGPMSVGEMLDVGEALCGALGALHGAGVLHRDVKPTNLAYTADRTLKLLDFGVARMVAESRPTPSATPVGEWSAADPATTGGIVLGTPLYMSPEARTGEPPDGRFDLWSSALVLYECLAGHAALRAAIEPHLRDRSGRTPVTDVRAVAPAVPLPVAMFLAGALSPDLEARPGSAQAFLRGLRALREWQTVRSPGAHADTQSVSAAQR